LKKVKTRKEKNLIGGDVQTGEEEEEVSRMPSQFRKEKVTHCLVSRFNSSALE